MAQINLGRIQPIDRGTYSPSYLYKKLDFVRSTDGNSYYACIQDAPAGTPLTNATYFRKVIGSANEASGVTYSNDLTDATNVELALDQIFKSLSNQESYVIGQPGTMGFGVGAYQYDDLATLGLSPLAGHSNILSDSYGNYQHTNGSVMVFVPKFYYRIGNAAHPKFATYGANSIEIAGTDTYADEAAANADGFALHRAFIDGGVAKSGFFIDKYIASKSPSDANVAVSVKLGVPISLTAITGYTRSNGMPGCAGILADSIVLSKARGSQYNCSTVFMRSAIAMLSLAHGQYADTTNHCAWYDPAGTTNFPKGCNNSTMGDVNDPTLSFVSAGDSGTSSKPKTGSASDIAKTTHNGQLCGVVDVNGALWETDLGITNPGSSATDSERTGTNDFYILKESISLASITADYNTATSAWGDAGNLSAKYDVFTSGVDVLTTNYIYWGNGTNPALFNDLAGTNLALSGVFPIDDTSVSASGVNLYGQDGFYRYDRANLFVLSSGNWGFGSTSGVWTRNLNYFRSGQDGSASFRSSAFGQ